jgi:hypothetical protein
LLLLFQYGKILTYINCRIESIINNSAQCDCEKQIKNSSDNNQSAPIQKTVIKEKTTEELFTIVTGKDFYNKSVQEIILYKPATTLLLTGFNKTIFQPPRA